MNVEQKAENWLAKTGYQYSETVIKSLALLLLEQDRDTRHACAEAVIGIDTSHYDCGVITEVAENRIMNCRGGVE